MDGRCDTNPNEQSDSSGSLLNTNKASHQDIFKILPVYLSKLDEDDTSITYTMVRMSPAATAVTRMMFWGVVEIRDQHFDTKLIKPKMEN